ncbi:tumor necrosis factor receptor superfamily member 14-like isoform X2 [Thunnus albacares]|uniref:tumor necrosis factor receptor superfamily member 14-like isoform X2 n=1 Tax=Thunnus albacares TaxID=8236 RepID=UPI001CF67FDD|nr:tumor necrosis factor receptor superfamily member 14-like isoform X2 [Thunnus albacares]
MSSSLLFLIIILKVFSGHSLTCHRAEYQIGGECCPMCLAGSRVKTDCTEFRSTSCLPCTDGTYMNHPTGLKYCLTCGNCDSGSGLQIKTSCTSTSNTVCQPLEGFYCMDPTEDGCVKALKHTSCQPGQYIRQKGTALRDTECTDCSDGTFSDGTFTSCQPHTQCESPKPRLIKPGTDSTDAECGEQSSHVITTVICVIVVPVLLIVIAISVYFIIKKKPLLIFHQNENRNGGETLQTLSGSPTVSEENEIADIPKQEVGEETSEMLNSC